MITYNECVDILKMDVDALPSLNIDILKRIHNDSFIHSQTVKDYIKSIYSVKKTNGSVRAVQSYFPISDSDPLFALRLTSEGIYSVSQSKASIDILYYIKKTYIEVFNNFNNIHIIDATGNNGGDTIRFGLDPDISLVNSIEINEENYNVLKHNIQLYDKLKTKVNVHLADMRDYISVHTCNILYVDPPWGGFNRIYNSSTFIKLHLASSLDQYTDDNEVFKTIASLPLNWDLCCVKIPDTLNKIILKKGDKTFVGLKTLFNKHIIRIYTIQKCNQYKLGIALVLLYKKRCIQWCCK